MMKKSGINNAIDGFFGGNQGANQMKNDNMSANMYQPANRYSKLFSLGGKRNNLGFPNHDRFGYQAGYPQIQPYNNNMRRNNNNWWLFIISDISLFFTIYQYIRSLNTKLR